jgi:hypothetical protein
MALNYWIAFIDLEFGISPLGKNNKKNPFLFTIKGVLLLACSFFLFFFFLEFLGI